MKFADLHLHTIFSDSTYTPQELIKEAKENGLAAIAVVDHDTVDGIAPCLKIGEAEGLEVVPGIELSTEYENTEVHILGYLIDYQKKELLAQLDSLKKIRIERIYKIADKLRQMNIQLDTESVFSLAGKGNPGRLHVARAMVKQRLAGSIFEVFQKYLGDGCPAYVCDFKISPREAIKLIRDALGIPVLAHPYLLQREEIIPEFVRAGLMGLEAYYPEHTQGMVNYYLGLAQRYNLLVTGGSDCHGKAKSEIKIGLVKVPYELVEKLKEARLKL